MGNWGGKVRGSRDIAVAVRCASHFCSTYVDTSDGAPGSNIAMPAIVTAAADVIPALATIAVAVLLLVLLLLLSLIHI